MTFNSTLWDNATSANEFLVETVNLNLCALRDEHLWNYVPVPSVKCHSYPAEHARVAFSW